MSVPGSDRLRVAVVGTGWWAGEHARIFSRRPDTELVAIVGRTPEKTQRFADTWGVPAHTDLDKMLESARPDLVTTALPNEAHFEPTMHLIERGVPLLLEKPLVFDLEEADAIVAAVAERGSFAALNFNHRFAEPVVRAKAALDAGELGDIVFTTWRFAGEPNFGAHPFGNLIETQCHGFDMLEHLVGPIRSVMAQATVGARAGYYTTLAIALEFENGAVGSFLGSYDSSYAYPGAQHIEINGSAGRAVIEDTVKRLTLQKVGDESRTVWEAGYFNDEARTFGYTFDRHVDRILAALRAGAEPPVGVAAGRRALQIAYAVIASFEEGRRINLPVAPRA
jgi:predicted dehydrogenase